MYSSLDIMENKQLKYGKTVIYEDKVGRIKSISQTDNVLIHLFSDNTTISVKKSKLKTTPHDKNELIKYKECYFIISDILLENEYILYKLSFINSCKKSNKNKDIIIGSNEKKIISIEMIITLNIPIFNVTINKHNIKHSKSS